MNERFVRTELLLGSEGVRRLQNASVAVFGVGGVGSYAVEALARAGVGRLLLVDKDTVSESNINRQLVAVCSTVGQQKVEVAAARVHDINPACQVETYPLFYLPETAEQVPLAGLSYVVDAIDTVAAKLELITRATAAGVPVISCMGAGNKLDPTRFEVADIAKTSVCPLARVMRRELRLRGVTHCKVVYSKEPPLTPVGAAAAGENGHHQTPGSVSFVPSVAGLILAGEVIKDIAGVK